jgi:hypothetical protein
MSNIARAAASCLKSLPCSRNAQSVWQVLAAAALVVSLAQFIHQVLQMRRERRSFRAKALLQPFADGIADRSAGLTINLFRLVGDSAIHPEFRLLSIL